MRAYSPVTMAREVMKETTISGCPVKANNMVLLSFPAANRDPAMFPDADKVVIDRKENRHAAFGLGIHRCVGSNLARMEMQVAIEEWLKRIPEFRLDPAGKVSWSEGTVRGPARSCRCCSARTEAFASLAMLGSGAGNLPALVAMAWTWTRTNCLPTAS